MTGLGPTAALVLLLVVPMPALAATPSAGVSDYAARGPYEVDVREIDVPRPGTTERFGANLYVPLPGPDAAADSATTSPLFAFGHGFLSPVGLYGSTLEHLASWGITVMAPRSAGGPQPDHAAFASDLLATLDHMAAEAGTDAWAGLPVDTGSRGVGGHSMGGGAAVLAAAQDPTIATVATLSAADTRPSAVSAAGRVQVPMLLLAGSEDRITPVDEHQRPIFEAAAGPAQLRTIEGGGHCGYLDRADLLGLVCGRASLPDEEQRALGLVALTAWLRAQLLGNPTAAEPAWNAGPDELVIIETRGHGAAVSDTPTPLIIDCDTGIDDALALLYACASPEAEIVGRQLCGGQRRAAAHRAQHARGAGACGPHRHRSGCRARCPHRPPAAHRRRHPRPDGPGLRRAARAIGECPGPATAPP